MTKKLDVNSSLIKKARRIGKHKRKDEAVTAASIERIGSHRQMRILELEGKIDFDPDFDYQKARQRH